jgi:tetratricopeptide (TPR) repeat protein
LETQGNFDEAVKNYRLAIEKNPSYINARYGLATTLLKQKKTNEAIEEYRQILKINPNHPHARRQLEKLTGR